MHCFPYLIVASVASWTGHGFQTKSQPLDIVSFVICKPFFPKWSKHYRHILVFIFILYILFIAIACLLPFTMANTFSLSVRAKTKQIIILLFFFSIRHHNGHDNKAELCGNSMMILTETFSVIFKWNKNGEIPTPYYAIDGFEVRLAHKIHIRSVISIFPSVCASFFSKWFLLFKCLIFRKCK